MDLETYRKRIDQIDDEILVLFKRRLKLAGDIAQYKKEHGLPILNAGRERDILYRMCTSCDGDLQYFSKILYNTLFDISRTYQNTLIQKKTAVLADIETAVANQKDKFPLTANVACQGIEGAYSQLAAESIFSVPSIEYMNTFDGVFNAVDKGLCEYGVLPVENSTAGSVTAVYELMKRYKFHIARGVKLRVNHALLAKDGATLNEIKEIYSHEQAVNQCSEFLKAHPHIKVTVCENTAVAAMMVAESGRRDAAALSSKNCASLYDLSVLSGSVQNSENNYTRFICIAKELQIYKGADKISLMLSLDHKAGALYSLVTKFSVLGLNLTKLESRPMKGTDFEFMFYFDVEGSVEENRVYHLMEELTQTTDSFAFLGNYTEL